LVLVVRFARLARADEPRDALERAPGTVGDPVAATAELQLAVLTPEGLSIDGAMPFEVRTLVDGFETPLFHLGGRSALTWWGSSLGIERAPGVQWSDGVAQLESTTTLPRSWGDHAMTLTTLDVQVAANLPGSRSTLRAWWPWDRAWPQVDGQASQLISASRHLIVRASVFVLADSNHYDDEVVAHPDHHVSEARSTTRFVVAELYRRGAWTGTLAQSALFATDTLDRGSIQHHDDVQLGFGARNELRRALRNVAGLARLDVAIGAEANVTHHDLGIADAVDPHEAVPTTGIVPSDDVAHRFAGTVWTSDVGAWTSATARLAPGMRVTTGVRADAFGSDLALQPRGTLEVELADRVVATLDAGAYRRAPDHGDELEHPELHPERTSRVAVGVERRVTPSGVGTFAGLELYYLDRTNLVEDDGTGKLANTGRGTTYGVHGTIGVLVDHWFALAALVLEHSDRQATPTTRTRPFEYDQPVRFDARVTRFLGAWQLGAHFELREGLPYTRVAGALYDADRDVYLPAFGPLYAERLPWQHQLDVRVDRALGSHLRAYLDIANVYDHRAAIGWDYNFNFTQRRAIAAPAILPTIGIRGEL
jgi:hypothetical protein